MAVSDASVKSLELWNDGPAVQATLGQMQQFQAQMQRQLQEQMEQVHLLIGTLPQTCPQPPVQPQPTFGFPIPMWPQQPASMTPFFPAAQQDVLQKPHVKRPRVRAGKLGKRERAEMRASRAGTLQRGDHRSDASEEEVAGDGWLLAGDQDSALKVDRAETEATQQQLEALVNTLKAEFHDSFSATIESNQQLAIAIAQMTHQRNEQQKETQQAVMQIKTDLQEFMAELNTTMLRDALSELRKEIAGKIEIETRHQQLEEFIKTLKSDFGSYCGAAFEDNQKMTMSATAQVIDRVNEDRKEFKNAVKQVKTDLQKVIIEHSKTLLSDAALEFQTQLAEKIDSNAMLQSLEVRFETFKLDFQGCCNTIIENNREVTRSTNAQVMEQIHEHKKEIEDTVTQIKTDLQDGIAEHCKTLLSDAASEFQTQLAEKKYTNAMLQSLEVCIETLKLDFQGCCNTILENNQEVAKSTVAQVMEQIKENEKETKDVVMQIKNDVQDVKAENISAMIRNAISEVRNDLLDELSAQIKLANTGMQEALEQKYQECASRSCDSVATMKVGVEDVLHCIASKLDISETAVDELKQDVGKLLASASAPQQRLFFEDTNSLPEVRLDVSSLADASSQNCATQQAGPSTCSASAPACQGIMSPLAVGSVSDRFSSALKGSLIHLHCSDSVAGHKGAPGVWNSVYGKRAVDMGVYEWNLKILDPGKIKDNNYGMVIGISADPFTERQNHFWAGGTNFGYIQKTGEKLANRLEAWSNQHCTPYAPSYAADDVVSVVLDMTNLCLSFKRNGVDLGIAYYVPAQAYHLAVSLLAPGQKVELL